MENESDMDVESIISSSKQGHESNVQNIDKNSPVGVENPDISNKLHQVSHNRDCELDTNSRHVSNMNEERNELNNIDSSEHVDNSAELTASHSSLAQRRSDINAALSLQYSYKDNVLYDTKYSVETPNHIERPYYRISTKRKSKQFFPEVSKDISLSDNAAIGTSLSGRKVTSYNNEHSIKFGRDVFQDDDLSKDELPYKTYQRNAHILVVGKNIGSYNSHHTLRENIDQDVLSNTDVRNQTPLLKDQQRDISNHSGYHHNRNITHHRHSHHLQHMEVKPIRSLVEPIPSSEFQDIHWPVKREAVVEGDLILGGLMMVHEREDTKTCGPVMPQGGIQALETMLYTLDVLNSDSDKIPNVTIGAHILDDCDKDTYGLEMAVDFIKGRRMWLDLSL
jgi:hypothetical protein